jgi:ribose 5-phosphate isomerase
MLVAAFVVTIPCSVNVDRVKLAPKSGNAPVPVVVIPQSQSVVSASTIVSMQNGMNVSCVVE